MNESAHFGPLLQRLLDGTAREADRETLREAIAVGRLIMATGARAMAVGGNVTDGVIVTGDGNIVLKHADAAALRQAFLALYPARLRQLPADLPDFTGREQEVDKLLDLFLDGSGKAAISALGGMGGVGKTALAVHVAHKLAEHYPEAQIVVDLVGTAAEPLTPVAVMGLVITAFTPQARLPESQEEVAAIYRSVLHGRRVLLLLDNAADSAQVRGLLPSPPAAAIVTSRRTITLPGLTSLNLDVLSETEARDLLRSILGDGRASDQEITAIAERCGRLPLALRAAGSFLASHRDWRVGEYLEALAQEKERLRHLKHEDLEVEAALGLSAAGLARENPEWAGRWQMLTVFPASFDRAGAGAVWEVEEEEARDTLSELLTRSLVLFDSDTGRYRLHDLMRLVAGNDFSYGGASSDTAGDSQRLAQAGARHAAYYLMILSEADDFYLQGGEALMQGLQLFDRENDNIRAGQAWAAAQAGSEEGTDRLCNAYPSAGAHLLFLRLHPRERIVWLEAALAAARRLQDRSSEASHLGNLGVSYKNLGEVHQAIEFYELQLEIDREMGNRWGEESALGNMGNAYYILGESRRAIDYYEQALAISREIGDRRGEGNALGNLGVVYSFLGEYRRAIEYHEQALGIFREIGDRQGEGNALGNLGNAYKNLGEYRQAIEFYEQRLVIAREIGDREGEGNARFNMGLTLDKLGERQQAIVQAEQALEIYEQIESPAADKVRKKLAIWRQEGSPDQAPDQS